MKKALPILLFSLALAACRQEQPLAVEEHLLVDILCDVHTAEGILQERAIGTQDSLAQLLYGQICRIHGVQLQDFLAAMDQVGQDPKRTKALYETVVERLMVLEASSGQ